jgi:hypothetical protein
MLQILIWLGSGFAFAIGLVVGISAALWMAGNSNRHRDEDVAMFRERNNIERQSADALARIAYVMEMVEARKESEDDE